MVVECKICNGQFDTSPDSVILCDYKDSIIHLGCCVNNCSWDKKPCKHALSLYEKIN
jgi:hypothetical protein